MIRLEASSICQLRCPSWPTWSKAIYPAVGSGFLKIGDFAKILDENRWVKDVELSNYGEIFLNPELLEIMKYAYERGVILRADNGANLNHIEDSVLEGLVRYKFRSISCSIDGVGNTSYRRYRVGGDFDTVIRNVRKINHLKEQARSEFPQLAWQFVVFGYNEREIEAARSLAGELGMLFRLKLTWDDKFSPLLDPDRVRKEIGAASRREFKEKHGFDYQQGICHQLWDHPQINWDGKVLGCCRNFWGDFGGMRSGMDCWTASTAKGLNTQKACFWANILRGMVYLVQPAVSIWACKPRADGSAEESKPRPTGH